MTVTSLLTELKNDLIKKSTEYENSFVSLCLDLNHIKMRHTVNACDFNINEDNINIEADNFILSIASKACFEFDKVENEFETEYIFKNETLGLYIAI